MPNQNLALWKDDKLYADIFRKRATGELPEMESSKAAAVRLEHLFTEGDSILDVGCGAGHYLISYKNALGEKNFTYTGLDVTPEYIDIAKDVFKDIPNVNFNVGSIYELPFADASFDIVVCNNVLLHLPEVRSAIKELLRVTKKYLLIRTLVGEKSYRIQDVYTKNDLEFVSSDIDMFNEQGEPKDFFYYNIYSKRYIEAVVRDVLSSASITIEEDRDFDSEKLSQNKDHFKNRTNATTMVDGMQVNGNIILPWSFITVKK